MQLQIKSFIFNVSGEIFKKLVNKNTIKIIKPKIRDPLAVLSQKPLPPRQKSELPPPLDFQPVCNYDLSFHLIDGDGRSSH